MSSGRIVHAALPHESAHLHVQGAAPYVDDIAELAGTLHAAFGLSPHAHAVIVSMDLSAVRSAPGVVAVLTAKDIPGDNDCGPIIHDDPVLASGEVLYAGQPVFLVVAQTRLAARKAARKAKIAYTPLPAVLDPEQAHAKQQYVVPPMHMQRGNAQAALAKSPHRLKGTWRVGGQEQFYLEGQIAYAIPKENATMLVYSSTQHPSEMQFTIAHALGWQAHQVTVECRRMGGGFGGKESQSALFSTAAALAANHVKRPVKLRPDRDDDMVITGKRHDFVYHYDIGYTSDGAITALKVDFISRAGFSADLSGPVMTRAMCHVDNAYYINDIELHGYCAKTNTQSNTAFRGFGGPQGTILIEYLIDSIARHLHIDPLTVRERNLYGSAPRNVTPYGMTVDDNIAPQLLARVARSSEYLRRKSEIAKWNATSPLLKRGIAVTPVKFGIAFNLTHLNQAGALVHVYLDGSVLVNHGGTEMGQGLHIKVMQVVAQELGVPLDAVRVSATDTGKVANTSATAASTGADLNAKAAQIAARKIKDRMAAFAANQFGVDERDIVFEAGRVKFGNATMPFGDLARAAYAGRVQLWSDGFYSTPKIHWDMKTMTGRPFYYFAYGAAVSEVVIDTLTGEWKLLRADVLHDCGKSLNPAIDKGQVEGAFIQGMGWLTTEELVWKPDGALWTHAPSTYKIPVASDCPRVFNVELWEGECAENSIHKSKAVGEPPLLNAISVFMAIRDAVAHARADGSAPELEAPATSERILMSVTRVNTETSSATAPLSA
jgi:xanthine dehydrogenase large subunit